MRTHPKPTAADEKSAGVTVEDLAAIFVLDGLRGFGPQKFKELHLAGIPLKAVLDDPDRLPFKGKIGDTLRALLRAVRQEQLGEYLVRAERQVLAAVRYGARILTYKRSDYPQAMFDSNYPVPVLFARGSLAALGTPAFVACVGSRNIRQPYTDLHHAFARAACVEGLGVASGFALGADTIGHRAALQSGGSTVCVMPGGLDRPFPPENRPLWDELLQYRGAVFVTEFSFGTIASALTLRKRNKSIVAISRGVLVSQSSATGGAMNAYRFAVEQRKPVATFADDGREDTSGNAAISASDGTKVDATTFNGRSPDVRRFSEWLHRL